jgi:hypothetical protein
MKKAVLCLSIAVAISGCQKNQDQKNQDHKSQGTVDSGGVHSVPILEGGKSHDSDIAPDKIKVYPINKLTVRTGVVDCRAGCRGDAKKCQESVLQAARIDSLPGKVFDASTLRISRQWNASDSPGLIRTPNFFIERWPANSSHPTSIIIRPNIRTCEGRSKHTQGVTFYEFSVNHF